MVMLLGPVAIGGPGARPIDGAATMTPAFADIRQVLRVPWATGRARNPCPGRGDCGDHDGLATTVIEHSDIHSAPVPRAEAEKLTRTHHRGMTDAVRRSLLSPQLTTGSRAGAPLVLHARESWGSDSKM